MITAIKLLFLYHVLLALLGLAQRAPHAWWQFLPHGSALKMWFCRRLWVVFELADGWMGYYVDEDRRRLYLFLAPYVGLRLDFSWRKAEPSALCKLLFGEIAASDRAKRLSNGALGLELCNGVWAKFAMGTQASILVGEAMDRLRALPEINSGAMRIARERLRGIQEEGFTSEHDDAHTRGEMIDAGLSYIYAAINVGHPALRTPPREWPWESQWWKPSPDRMRNLEIAGALFAAEIDRLERARQRAVQPVPFVRSSRS